MKRSFCLNLTRTVAVATLLAATAVCETGSATTGDQPGSGATEVAPTEASRVVSAANAFLATLDEKQRAKVLFAFDDREQRSRWSNFPTTFVPRAGISLKELTDTQRAAATALLASVFSPRGFEKIQQIMEGDEALKSLPDNGPPQGPDDGHGGPPFRPDDDKHRPPFGPDDANHQPPPRLKDGGQPPRPDSDPSPAGPDSDRHGRPHGPRNGGPPFGGGGTMFGKDLYYLSFLGKPSATEPWILQFGGHHLAVNITIAGEQGVLTPTLTGAQPALYELNGKTVRPLGKENDTAFALLAALNDEQRKQAILNYRVADLVLGPGHDGETIQPEGLKVSGMDENQRAMLLDLIMEWTGIVNDAYAAPRLAEIRAGLDDTWFAWSGPTTHEPGKNGTAYYRLQGPKLVIEFSPQGIGGDLTMHVHTMYRDPTNDYGRALTTSR